MTRAITCPCGCKSETSVQSSVVKALNLRGTFDGSEVSRKSLEDKWATESPLEFLQNT